MDPVIVVGAGPVGLALALALAGNDVPVLVLDAGGGISPETTRTTVLRPDTTAFLGGLGYRRVVGDGAGWHLWRTLDRRRELLELPCAMPMTGGGQPDLPVPAATTGRAPARRTDSAALAPRTPPVRAGGLRLPEGPATVLHLEQHRLQRGLRDAVTATPLVRIVQGVRVDGVQQDDTGVSVRTVPADDAPEGAGPARAGGAGGPGPGGAEATWWRGSYLVGCDGALSAVRKLLRVRFPGRTAVDRHAVATIRAALPFDGEARLQLRPPWHRAEQEVTARPLPDGIWRIDWRLPGGSGDTPVDRRSPQQAPMPADELLPRLRGALEAWCGGVPRYELLGASQYVVHQRLARTWRVGRAFLAGDAAHLLGALGTQSVDEGLRDAENLAWKLSLAWHGQAGPGLLDSYQIERRGSVGARLRAADQALPLLRPRNRLQAARRALLYGSTRRHAPLLSAAHLGAGPLGEPPAYLVSPLTHALPPAIGPEGQGRSGGSRNRSGQRGRGGRASAAALRAIAERYGTAPGCRVEDVPVTDMAGGRHRLTARLGWGLVVLLVAPGTEVWPSEHWLHAGMMPELSAATRALPVPAELLVTERYLQAPAHSVLLIRPDGHLAAAMPGCRPEELRAWVEAVRGGSPADGAPTGTAASGADRRARGTRGPAGAAMAPATGARTGAAGRRPGASDDRPGPVATHR
ncbi:FAD-dependent monooxygenase [Allostreptomyces psammosilenae]|uniref:3-(3-hydroxy-phenyl)propionate hydroxylase n=1 Tax=Allostreptomyces psammosilenae TaxID=1892865 RepID=A0A852ZNM7_9ACTN|nr:FAD-dependent monooxygenase [Allostreptomyces psammosilenae]NYI03077.1 3-(3-hydroxy-phenyl)propionate hydroxylase [Allostreptomyces psammosilenae]